MLDGASERVGKREQEGERDVRNEWFSKLVPTHTQHVHISSAIKFSIEIKKLHDVQEKRTAMNKFAEERSLWQRAIVSIINQMYSV